jgi:peroxiredoxin
MRTSSVAILAGVIIAGFTAWITHQAKALERDLDVNAQKIELLDKPAPDFHVTAFDGRAVSLGDYRGKKLGLVFFATWNNGSHPEMNLLSLIYKQAHKPDTDYDIVGIAVDDDLAAVKQFANDMKLQFPLALDRNREVANVYQIRILPTSLVVDTDGKVIYGSAGIGQGHLNEFMRALGVRPGDFPMEMGGPRGRGN